MQEIYHAMAYTKGLRTLSAGFTRLQLITFWGEILADLGVMPTATSWYDSYTTADNSPGCEVRVVEEVVDATKTYGTVYHIFGVFPDGNTTGSFPDAIYYQQTPNWDNVNHTCVGTYALDYAGPASPGLNSFSNWQYYFAPIARIGNSSDLRIHTFLQSGEPNYALIQTSSANYVVGYHPMTGSDFIEPTLLDGFMPQGLFGISGSGLGQFYGAYGFALPRSISGNTRSTTGSSTNSCPTQGAYTGWATTSGSGHPIRYSNAQSDGMMPSLVIDRSSADTDPGMAPYSYQPRYVGHSNIPFDPTVYTNKSFGKDFVFLAGYNHDNNSPRFIPNIHDELIVTPGVEEYYVIDTSGSNPSDNADYNFSSVLLRTV